LRGEERSDEDEEDDSEGASSGNASKRNSLALNNGVKSPILYAEDLVEKTPTAATILAQAQAAPRAGSFPPQAPIRRHTGPDGSVSMQSHPSSAVASGSYTSSQQSLSIRQMPHFPSIEEAIGSNSSTSAHSVAARELWGWFVDHLDALLDSVRFFRFDQFEIHVRSFWTNLSGNHREVAHAPAIAGLMAKGDAIVYDVRLRQGHCGWAVANVDDPGNLGTITLAIALINSGGIHSESASAGRQDGENLAHVS
jgi:regulatory factor X, other